MKQFSFYLFIHLVRVAIVLCRLSMDGPESKFRVSGSGYDGQCQWAMLGVSGIREGVVLKAPPHPPPKK